MAPGLGVDCPNCKTQLMLMLRIGGGFGDQPTPKTDLQTAIAALLDAKAKANLRPVYLSGLRCYLLAFAKGREETPVSAITTADLDRWFAGRSEKPRTMASNIGRLRSLFSFAQRRGWLHANPCDGLEHVRLDTTAPRILTPAEVRALFAACPARLLPYLTLAVFAGIRPDEILGLTWADVRWDLGAVMVNRTKTRRRRIVPLEPNALEWLKTCDQSANLCPSLATVKRDRKALRAALNGDWPQDVLRHTAASYLLNLHGDAGKVAMRLGNSAGILMRHYYNMVSAEATAEFWAVKPKPAETPIKAV